MASARQGDGGARPCHGAAHGPMKGREQDEMASQNPTENPYQPCGVINGILTYPLLSLIVRLDSYIKFGFIYDNDASKY